MAVLLFNTNLCSVGASFLTCRVSLPSARRPIIPSSAIPGIHAHFPMTGAIPRRCRSLAGRSPTSLGAPSGIGSIIRCSVEAKACMIHAGLNSTSLAAPVSLAPRRCRSCDFRGSIRSCCHRGGRRRFRGTTGGRFGLTSVRFGVNTTRHVFKPNNIQIGARNSTRIRLNLGRGGAGGPSLPRHTHGHAFFGFSRGIRLGMRTSINDGIGFSVGCGARASFSFSSGGLGLTCAKRRSRVVGSLRTKGMDVAADGSLVGKKTTLFNVGTSLRFKGLQIGTLFTRRRSRSGAIDSGKNIRAGPFRLAVSRCSRGHRFFLSRCFHSHCSRTIGGLGAVSSPIAVDGIRI